MSGAASTVEPDAQVAGLREAFETFSRSAQALGQAYSALEARAALVDLELARANALQGKILESIPSGLVARDAAGRVTAVNGAALAILGLERAGAQGERLLDLEAADGSALLGPLAPAGVTAEERSFVRPDGRAVALVWTRTPLGGEPGRESAGCLDVFTDVTEVQRLRAEVAARERLTALGETAAALAHQVRNPLNGFQGFLGLLQRELAALPESAPARLYAGKALEGARELERVVAGILAVARPETLERRVVGVASLARDAVASLEAAGMPVARITVDAPASLSVHADALRLKQAVVNLLENALAATPESGRIRVRARARGRTSVLLEVEDEGSGIDPALLPRLFQPFATTRAHGSGLGLAYVRKVVELHGGAVSARNLKSRGARFTIELPVARSTPEGER